MTSQNLKISNIKAANEAILLSDIYLIVVNPSHIPPHISLSINGKLFSLSVKGPTINGDMRIFIKMLQLRKTEALFIKLSLPNLFSMQELYSAIEKYTLEFPYVDIGLATCLTPIKNFCGEIYKTETRDVNFVFDLLPKLTYQEITGECYHYNMQNNLVDNAFLLNRYTMDDINNGIKKANLLTPA